MLHDSPGYMTKGQVISGDFGEIVIRQKSGSQIELGELLVSDSDDGKILLQAYDLNYGSQISQQNLELISGMRLEEDSDLEFMDPNLRNYLMASCKTLLSIDTKGPRICKKLPSFFSGVREVKKEDLSFLTKPKNPIFLGNLRSGSKTMDVGLFADGKEVFSHHILIPATTGRGKSNLTSCILWDSMDKDYCGMLVLDPHDEYYGRNGLGLKDHPEKDKFSYYTPKDPPPGTNTLKINIQNLRPYHFEGAAYFSDAQKQAMGSFYKEYGSKWIEAIILEKPLPSKVEFIEATLSVVRRRLLSILDLQFRNNQLFCNGIFDIQAGQNTISDITGDLEKGKTVIIDTSSFSGSVEILVGSMVANEILRKYRRYKVSGELAEKPVISIVIEEAPRVLGKEVLESGSNIFSKIAREGRKFKVGLTAITQLPSLIPRDILANMNTKIILGIEMKPERQAIIESASQDLSTDDRSIASLDKGEAIISSNFVRFATPVKIPLFSEFVKEHQNQHVREKHKKDFSGVHFG